MTLNSDAKFEVNWLVVVWRMTGEIWQIFTRALESLQTQNWDFDGILLFKIEDVWA